MPDTLLSKERRVSAVRLRALLLTPSLALKPPLRTWAILDAAREPRVRALAEEDPGARCLYREPLDPALAEVAPWLVPLEADSALTDLFVEGWGSALGIAFESSVTIDGLLRHFRGLLRVKTEDGDEFLFRPYDPRVLRVYLPTVNADEVRLFGGPIHRFLSEAEDPATALTWTRTGNVLAPAIFDLEA